jgi:cytosine/uracil/thiamine/allantoin permease
MSESALKCEVCGAPAIIHITSDIDSSHRIRHFCMDCASLEERQSLSRKQHLHFSAMIAATGFFILLLSTTADFLKFGADPDLIGWRQMLGLALAVALVGAAAALRVVTLAAIGGIAFVVFMLADLLQFGSSEGFGKHQQIGVILGSALIFLALAMVRIGRNRSSP